MTAPLQVTAIVLAGGGSSDPLAAAAGVTSKAYYPFEGRPLIAYVLDALASSNSVAGKVVVTPPDGVLPAQVDARVPPGCSFANSLALGMGAALAIAPERPLLLVTADLPWLTATAVDRFIAQGADADLAYPVVTRETSLAAFPEQRRTFVRTRQGHLTGGNLALLRPEVAPNLLELMERAYRARKNPVALAALLGPKTLIDLFTGQAQVPRLETIVSGLLNAKARAVISEDACLAADLDRLPGVRKAQRVKAV